MDEADLIKRCRRALGVSQRQLAQTLLLQSSRNIRRWEDGYQAVSGPAWVALRHILNEHGEHALADEVAQLIQERLARTWRISEEESDEDSR